MEQAWSVINEASACLDIDTFKQGLIALNEADKTLTYVHIENELRRRGVQFFLIGLQKETPPQYTLVNLQGEASQTFTLGVYKSPTCPRPLLKDAWPKDPSENLTRLADTGEPSSLGPVCGNCNLPGHLRKDCQQEKSEYTPPTAQCVYCGEPHQSRHCTQERPKPRSKRTCRHCESEDHLAAECPDKPAPSFTCRNCLQEGHKASDCTNERVLQCRNCDEIGHIGRDCTQPRDWSRVTCRYCGAIGHASEKLCDPQVKAAFAKEQAEKVANSGGAVQDGGDGCFDTAGNDAFGAANTNMGFDASETVTYNSWDDAPTKPSNTDGW